MSMIKFLNQDLYDTEAFLESYQLKMIAGWDLYFETEM